MDKSAVARVLASLQGRCPSHPKDSVQGIVPSDSKNYVQGKCPCVYVMTRWGTEYLGSLVFADRFMNIELENVQELSKGAKIRHINFIMLRPDDLLIIREA